MEYIETIRIATYGVNVAVCLILTIYFSKEYNQKRLRASLAWAIAFFLYALLLISMILMATVEITKSYLMLSYVFSALLVSLFYYGASLVFFEEKSFFRETMTILFFLTVIFLGSVLMFLLPAEEFIAKMSVPIVGVYVIIYSVIGILFYQSSQKMPEVDPRRKSTLLVSIAWFIIAIWNAYLAGFWLENPRIEALVFSFGSCGFILLLYGMTQGKTE